MRTLVRSGRFKRQYRLMMRRGKDVGKLDAVIGILAFDAPLPPALRDHPLVGNYAGFRDCHIEPDWVLVYKKAVDLDGTKSLYLEATGTHSDLLE